MTTNPLPLIRPRVLIVHGGRAADPLASFREALHGAGPSCAAEDCVVPEDLAVRLAQGRPDALVVLFPEAVAALAPAVRDAARSGLPVVAVGPRLEPSGVVEMLRLGAREYLEYDEADGAMGRSLGECFERLADRADVAAAPGRSLAVLAAVPGVGVTTVASGLAFALGRLTPHQVALAEFGGSVPQLALLLDRQPSGPLGELAARWEQADATMIRRAMVAHSAGVDLLLEAAGQLRPTRLQAAQARRLLSLLRGSYRATVLDLGSELTDGALEAVRLSEAVLVVARPDVPAIRLTRRLVEELDRRLEVASKVRVVVNRRGEPGQLDAASAARALGVEPDAWLPDAPRLVNSARNRGIPLHEVSRLSRLTRALGKLAARCDPTRAGAREKQ